MCRRSRSLMLLLTFAVVVGAGAAHATFIGHYRFWDPSRIGWNVSYAVILGVTSYAVGLPDKAHNRGTALALAVPAVVAAAAGMSVVQLVLGSLVLPRFVVGAAALLLTGVFVLCADLSLREREVGRRRERLLVVASPEEVATLTDDLWENSQNVASVVSSATIDDVRGRGTESQPLVDMAQACRPTVVVLDRAATADDSVVVQAAILHEQGVRVRTLTDFYEEWLGKLPLNELERVSLMFDIGELHRARYGRIKRVIDVVVATVGAALTLTVLPLVVLVDLTANRGPLFFRQERVGKGGTVFTIVKFRTCRQGGLDTSWTQADDPRVTAGGAWLRRMHIDELPNFLNILKGEMTLVGPRPEQPAYVDELSGKLPFYRLRHLVRPGLTGWAQVNYGYASDYLGALEKLQYDFYYLGRQSLPMDLRVLGRTLRAMFGGGR